MVKATFTEAVMEDTWWIFLFSFFYLFAGFMGWMSAFLQTNSNADTLIIFVGEIGILIGMVSSLKYINES